MALTPLLDLRQTQTLVMTPQLQQAIKLLQLNNLELTDYVEQQLEQNPLLEREGADGGHGEVDGLNGQDDPAAAIGGKAADEPGPVDAAVADDAGMASTFDMDVEPADLFDGDAGSLADAADTGGADFGREWNGREVAFEHSGGDLENRLSRPPSLREHLVEQLNVDVESPIDRVIGLYLIDLLDDAGYLREDSTAIAAVLGCDRERVEAVLDRLQHFDPPGVFARSVAECLSLQLRDRGRLDTAMQALLAHLPLVAKRDFVGLARVCNVSAQQLAAMIAEIRTLNPKPAASFDPVVAEAIVPDVIMRPHPGGGWLVELNQDTLPRVLVNRHYFMHVSRTATKKADKQYLNECYQSANWLVRSLNQRANTILRVASEIVKQQQQFFVKGVKHLRPLVLRDVAQVVEFHESTISRVTSNKYMATPRGIFELKYFFSHAIGSTNGGDTHSSEWVRQRIRSLVHDERADNILSDDVIVDILKKEGIDIARRTVAKYRDAMGLPSSLQRRRDKMMEA